MRQARDQAGPASAAHDLDAMLDAAGRSEPRTAAHRRSRLLGQFGIAASALGLVLGLCVGTIVWAVASLSPSIPEPDWPDSVTSVSARRFDPWFDGNRPRSVLVRVELAEADGGALADIVDYVANAQTQYEPAEELRLLVTGAMALDVTFTFPFTREDVLEAVG